MQVFDAGLIGEGALHILAHVQQRLVGRDYTLVPQSATLYCQGIQMRIDDVMGFDMAQMNRYRWRPTYEGMELGQCTHRWKALTAVQEVSDCNAVQTCEQRHSLTNNKSFHF
jgi:hypothetical protein